MSEYGFYHPEVGYWQTTTYPEAHLLADHPAGTIEVPLRPSPEHEWGNDAWVHNPPAPPTAEELRAAMPTVTARQLRHGLLNVNLEEADVEALIAAIPDEEERKRASIDWRTANEYERLHPLVIQISATLGLTPELVDSLWDHYQTI